MKPERVHFSVFDWSPYRTTADGSPVRMKKKYLLTENAADREWLLAAIMRLADAVAQTGVQVSMEMNGKQVIVTLVGAGGGAICRQALVAVLRTEMALLHANTKGVTS